MLDQTKAGDREDLHETASEISTSLSG